MGVFDVARGAKVKGGAATGPQFSPGRSGADASGLAGLLGPAEDRPRGHVVQASAVAVHDDCRDEQAQEHGADRRLDQGGPSATGRHHAEPDQSMAERPAGKGDQHRVLHQQDDQRT